MDIYFTIGAILIELGLPAVLIYIAAKKPSARYVIVPVVGAISPLLLVYVLGGATHLLFPPDKPSMFIAIFAMSFLPYCVSAGAGTAVGLFLPKEVKLHWRYLIAFFLASAVGLGLIAIL